ncbi:hypothetical protein K461DRAFT_248608 [Myriangium duriaei CBS 260.36]|uniref:non-specific serine/threonine protein kinase n=1 Tax=Myriangium duriaei CBS 260.36 TaxID=1168546 RepID=A0A9P4IQA4_9PEZI|nr:hypothetical protein K461DRAFT_248608 [Myriangium duriaei CBS 260.36]
MVGRNSVTSPVTGRTVNGNDVPPPSTYAAQLVQQHAPNAKPPPDADASTTFTQLLQAILHSDIAPETDADINYKVVRVVTEAGLEILPADDPFASWDVLIPQAIDSIAVIELTLRRQPGLLLFQQSGQNNNHDKAPMAIWLFASLIKASTHPKCGELAPHVERLLTVVVVSLANSLEFWQQSRSMLRMYQDAVDEILANFDEHPKLSLKLARSLNIKLPAVRSIVQFSSDPTQTTMVSSGSQTTLTKIKAVVDATCLILKAIVSSLGEDNRAGINAMSTATLVKWSLDAAVRIGQVALLNRKVFDSDGAFDDSANQSLSLLSDFCSYLSASAQSTRHNLSSGMLFESAISYLQACLEQPFTALTQDALSEILRLICMSDGVKALQESLADRVFQSISKNEINSLDLSEALRQTISRIAYGEDVILQDDSVTEDGMDQPLPKRPKLAQVPDMQPQDTTSTTSSEIIDTLLHVMGLKNAKNGTRLSGISKRLYGSLDEDAREQLWGLLAMLPCVSAQSFRNSTCEICHSQPCLTTKDDNKNWKQMPDNDSQTQLATALRLLISSKDLQNSPPCRTLAAFAVRSFVIHCGLPEQLDLSQSGLGEWCLRSLNSSSRDLRLSSGRAVAAFLREGLPIELRDNNRRMALDYYRTLSERANLSQFETMISAWGQIVRVCGDKERNLALLQLVEYLGHSNHFVCSLAADELEQCAIARRQEPSELCKPFLGSLAVSVVKDVVTNPNKLTMFSDFMRTASRNHFLIFTQKETVPFLVLTKRKECLQRVAAARGQGTTVSDIIVKSGANCAAVLALLLSQPTEDPAGFATAILVDVLPEMNEDDCFNLIHVETVSAVVQMLKYAGEEDSDRRVAIHKAIQSVGILYQSNGKSRSSHITAKAARSFLSAFFQDHVLGIMTQFSETIERQDENVTTQEKIRCLKGIEEMINLAKLDVSIGVPQIRACLQSAIDQGGLIDAAISAWLSLMGHLDGEDVVPLLDHLFSIIVQHWTTMSPALQQRTYDTVAELLKTQNDVIRDEVITVPSLASIPLMSKFESEISRLKSGESPERILDAFVKRLQDENASIVLQAAKELFDWLENHQTFVQEGVVSDPPIPIIATVTRTLLDACVKYNTTRTQISDSCAQCLGAIGCLDPNAIEANVSENQIVVLSNFEESAEIIMWVASLLTNIFVPAFRSATNARAQGFLAFAMQELLHFAEFEDIDSTRLRSSQSNASYEAWLGMPENIRNTLVPFLSSRYTLTSSIEVQLESYPIFSSTLKHEEWLKRWGYDMLWRGKGENAKPVFNLLARVIKNHDISIAKFLLPYVALNIVLGGIVSEAEQVAQEMFTVLSTESTIPAENEVLRQCSEDVFSVLDYMTRWVQEKKVRMAQIRMSLLRAGRSLDELQEETGVSQISSVDKVVSSIPAHIIAQRAIECGSYARALFHWENHIREQQDRGKVDVSDRDDMYKRLQSIYSEIDEPDGLDGIAAQISILTPEQQAFQHVRAGRWSAAQSWYEIELASRPDDHDLHIGLLTCLQRSGQSNQVVRVAKDLMGRDTEVTITPLRRQQLASFVMEAAWSTSDLNQLASGLQLCDTTPSASHFNISVGSILTAINTGNVENANQTIEQLRSSISRSLTAANSNSLAACHNQLLQLHILHDIDRLKQYRPMAPEGERLTTAALKEASTADDKRLAILGSFTADKQTILAIRRATMKASKAPLNLDIGKSWLSTARLARKDDILNVAHFAVLNADRCGDASAKIEQARLMWKTGQHRQAIQHIQKALDMDVFLTSETNAEGPTGPNAPTSIDVANIQQNMVLAKANLLLAKWLDASGQSQTMDVAAKYQHAARTHNKWEKGHYYLGKHYNMVLEANLALPAAQRDDTSLNGEAVKIIVENFLRSLPFGCKYWHQTIPKLITLWLGLGMDCHTKPRDISSNEMFEKRKEYLSQVHSQLKKYFQRVPKYAFYTALPQMISRISHPHAKVADLLAWMIREVVSEYPAQGLWGLLPVAKATSTDRASRGKEIIGSLRDTKSRKSEGAKLELRAMVLQGTRLQDGLLYASEVHIEGRSSNVSLSRDLGFSHKLSPNPLVVPFQFALTPNIPTVHDSGYLRQFKPFTHDKVTIASFSDDVLVLNSLQRPRKLTLRGSDGKSYGLLCKPKDDLRKDQRLMEFNTMINRALKRSPESSKRHLYIKTYGVTPLSEESGTIEWVEGIKPMRDILLKLYQRKGIQPNYSELRTLLNEASSHPSNYSIFTKKILPKFPPVLHEWFTELSPSPASWFASRLRYARSSAVMSMVGHVLGLGDRHGENILLEETSGGVFHVDFNCLFDKGLTFEKPELVPFRLTHNMVDAMGPALGVEGPFRRSAELVLQLLRTHHDALMNVLETFVHDPTTDFIGQRKKRATPGVADTPQGVLEFVSLKLRGYLRGESVPLSNEGLVQALIAAATDEGNLCRMYIGWCAFL